jgi:hypothetical protein
MQTPEEANFRQELENEDIRYRLSNIMPYLRIFNSPLPNKAPIFSKSDEKTYGKLYSFRDSITEWSFSVSTHDKFIRLLQKSSNAPFLLMSNEEHVLSIEIHHGTFIVITVDSDSNNRLHSIVIDTEVPTATFNIAGLLDTIKNTACESIRENLKSIQWTQEDSSALPPVTLHQRLTRVQVSLVTNLSMQVSRERVPYNVAGDKSNSASKSSMQSHGGGYRTPTPAKPRQITRKSIDGEAGSSRKRPRIDTPATSSGSALTNISTASRGSEQVIDYHKAAKTQENFLLHCQDCYPFGVDETFTINIEQMIVAQDAKHKQDAVVVRACEMKIVQGLKQFLTEMGDINQRQTICLTPCTEEGVLLPKKPESWAKIKDGMFLIINGQHSITASKLLQQSPVREARKIELQTWKAYIVWSLKKNQLLCISEWYNACNHLKHSQSTWGSNILSARTIWISYGRPTSLKAGVGRDRNNEAVYDLAKFAVSFTAGELIIIVEMAVPVFICFGKNIERIGSGSDCS